jgi:pimeloyl-ACP methyl ester carboxylesterase
LFAGVAVLVVAAAVLVGIRVLGGSTRSGMPAQDQLGTVVLVPGYGGNQGSLRELAARISASGRQTRVVTLPGDGTGDLLAQVAVLDHEVDDALASGAPSVDVIGYSAGGVVARLWVARDGGEHRARRVITLGSPLHGTTLAATGGAVVPDACPVACQQLAPGSALLTSVARSPVPLPWLSIWTENDQTVIPPDSARLDGAINVALQQICPSVHIEHSELPTHPAVTGLVLNAVGRGALTAPKPGSPCPSG